MAPAISPSQLENIPLEMLPAFTQMLGHESAMVDTPGLIPDFNVLIPRDDQDYRNEFNFVDNELYNDRSLASSVVRVVSINTNEPPQVYLGNELPVKISDSSVQLPQEPFWFNHLGLPCSDIPDVPKEPNYSKEENPQSFMIVPPIDALVEFTRELALSDSESPHGSGRLFACQVERKAQSRPSYTAANTTEFAFTSVSDPIKITKHIPSRFWRRNQSAPPHLAYRGFTGYVKSIFKKHHTGPRTKASIKQWVQTRNLIFWEHSRTPRTSWSTSCAKELSTS